VSDTIETLIDRLTERQRLEFALACARRVQPLMRDPRSVAALDTRERWLRGKAAAAARNAAAAARAARDAAAAARAARDAAWAAARDAARAAASAAAAAADAAWDAERAWQRTELERMLAEVKS
jgi:hypothetical protein